MNYFTDSFKLLSDCIQITQELHILSIFPHLLICTIQKRFQILFTFHGYEVYQFLVNPDFVCN